MSNQKISDFTEATSLSADAYLPVIDNDPVTGQVTNYKIKYSVSGVIPTKASGAEIIAGVNDTKFATPKAIKDADIAFLSDIPTVPTKASAAEVIAGTDDAKYTTPKALKDAGIEPVTSIDSKVSITSSDTTTDYLNNKLTAGDGIKKTVITPSGAETLDLDIDTADGNVFVTTPTYVYTPAYLTSSSSAESNTLIWDSFTNGEFSIDIDTVTYNVTGCDFTGVTTMANVASVIQARLRAATGSTETVAWSTNHFVITSANTSSLSEVGYTAKYVAGTGTDISGATTSTSNFMFANSGNGIKSPKVLVGTADEGKVPLINSNGYVDGGFINSQSNQSRFISGEAITLGNPVYENTSDGKVYICDGNVQAKVGFIGFASNSAALGEYCYVDIGGISNTQSGLTIGTKYYLSDTVGTISSSVGTYPVEVGVAVSTTAIEISRMSNIVMSSITETTYNIPLINAHGIDTDSATYFKTMEFLVNQTGTYSTRVGLYCQNGDSMYVRIYKNGVAYGTERNAAAASITRWLEDLAFTKGDLIQVYAKAGGGNHAAAYLQVLSRCDNRFFTSVS